MPIPDYQTIMLPLLKISEDGNEHSYREVIGLLADHFRLTIDERKKLFSSGRMVVFDNKVGWALSYLKGAGLLKSTKRGSFKITERGIKALQSKPQTIDNDFLKQYKEFRDFINRTRSSTGTSVENRPITALEDYQSPLELLESGYQKAKAMTVRALLDKVIEGSPSFFENLVPELLLKMGYGYGHKEIHAGRITGGSHDGGIDGIIYEDALGLDPVCFQAKKYGKGQTIGSQIIRDFLGALDSRGFTKGILITTASFVDKASSIESKSGKKIVLIDGAKLAELMYEYEIGVSKVAKYEIKNIDSDYFEENIG